MQFLHCNVLLDLRCILVCSAKKDRVPCKAGKALHVKRLGGEGSQGIKREKKGKMRKGRSKENQKWCIITRVGHGFTVKPSCRSVIRMSAEKPTEPMPESHGAERGEEKGSDLSTLYLLSFNGQGLCF